MVNLTDYKSISYTCLVHRTILPEWAQNVIKLEACAVILANVQPYIMIGI